MELSEGVTEGTGEESTEVMRVCNLDEIEGGGAGLASGEEYSIMITHGSSEEYSLSAGVEGRLTGGGIFFSENSQKTS